MASDPSLELTLTPIQGEGRTLEQWLTTFHLVSVVIDPYTNESAWILDTAARIMRSFTGAAVRVELGGGRHRRGRPGVPRPAGRGVLTFADPERTYVKALGLVRLPAFVFPPRGRPGRGVRRGVERPRVASGGRGRGRDDGVDGGGHPGAGGSSGLRRDAGLGLTAGRLSARRHPASANGSRRVAIASSSRRPSSRTMSGTVRRSAIARLATSAAALYPMTGVERGDQRADDSA